MLPAGSLWLLFGNHNLIDKLIMNQCWKKTKIRYMQYYKVVFLEVLWEVSTYFSVEEAYLLLELYDRCFNSCLVSGDTCMIVSVGRYINQQLFLKFLNHISSCYNLKLKKSSNYFSCQDCQIVRFNFFKRLPDWFQLNYVHVIAWKLVHKSDCRITIE